MVMAENKLADLSTEFAIQILKRCTTFAYLYLGSATFDYSFQLNPSSRTDFIPLQWDEITS